MASNRLVTKIFQAVAKSCGFLFKACAKRSKSVAVASRLRRIILFTVFLWGKPEISLNCACVIFASFNASSSFSGENSMFETSLSNIQVDYYISNEKIYPRNAICYKISNDVKFDARKFAEWMKSGFEKSPYKTLTALASAAASNKATISRLMTGAAQTLTNKPSQPNKELVKKLAALFNEEIDAALVLAGYAPEGVSLPRAPLGIEVLQSRFNLIAKNYGSLSDEDKMAIDSSIYLFAKATEFIKTGEAEKSNIKLLDNDFVFVNLDDAGGEEKPKKKAS